MTIDKNLTIDLNRVQPHKVMRIHEGDVNSVFLVLTLTQNGASPSFTGVTIKYDATIAGYLAEQDANGTISSGKIRIPITSNMTAMPGVLKIDVRMVSGTEVLHTQTITMIVERAIIDGSTVIDISGTTIGGRLTALEDDMDDLETAMQTIQGKFPIQSNDIASGVIPTKTSDLTNDSGFISQHQDISGKMNLSPGVPRDDETGLPDTSSSQFNALLPGQIFYTYDSAYGIQYWAKYRSQAGSFTYDALELLTSHQDITGKADIEKGTIPSNHAWYTDVSQGYTMTGSYTIIGDMCFLRGKAYIIPGWERVYYSLPVACVASGSTIALHNEDFFSVATGTQNNISVLEIKQIGSQYMSGTGTISFTLIYKCN